MNDKSEYKPWSRSVRSSWAGVGLLIAAADIATKKAVAEWLQTVEGNVYEVTFFLNFRSVTNPGAAFGFLAEYSELARTLLPSISIVATVVIYAFIMLYPKLNYKTASIAMLMLGGAVGNGFERLFHGYVYDFIDFHLFGYHWPAFNIADSSISLAMILLVWFYIFSKPSQPEENGKELKTKEKKEK